MRISIIIVNHNTKQLLKDCLDSIKVQNQNNETEVVVVDNASSDGSGDMVNKYFPEVKLIQNDFNVGFGAANNQGARIASGDFLLFVNSDATLQKNALIEIEKSMANTENAGAVGFKIINRDSSLQPSCGSFPTLLNLLTETLFLDRSIQLKSNYHIRKSGVYQNEFSPDWVSGSCFIISKQLFNKVAGFDDKFFLYVEEVDLCYRIKKNGYRNIYFPIEMVVHNNRASSISKNTAIIFTHHNLIHFFKKHHGNLSASVIYLLFILKSCIYSIIGMICGIFNLEQMQKARSYLFLLITLLSKKQYNNYENSIKQQN
ncbi:MAG: glycosyltransferase family 2 protein [Patescibacteria group bacterium]|jgi:hypothetical protein